MANNPDYLPPLNEIPVGANKNSPPTPPGQNAPAPLGGQDVDIRSMSGDVGSIQSSGGLGYSGSVSEPQTGASDKSFMPGGTSEEPLFSPQMPPAPEMPPAAPHEKGAHNKALIISAAAVLILLAGGGAAYFTLFRGEGTTPPPEPVPIPAPAPVPDPVPAPVEPPAPPPPPPFTHMSAFPATANLVPTASSVTVLDQQGIESAVSSALASETKVPVLRELALTFNEEYIKSPDLINALIPSMSSALTVAEDNTVFAYKDKDGVWPGMIFELNEGSEFGPDIQITTDFPKDLYIADPGAAKATVFKDGAKPSAAFDFVKYLQYSAPGASFNIGVFTMNGKKYVLMSTSFNGFKEAAKLLGI